MADEPKPASSRRASDAGLEALLQEIEADAKVSPARLPTNRRLEAFVGGFTASTFFATQDDGDAPLEVVPIPLPALRLQLSNLPDSLDFDLFELAQHELPSLLHYVLQDAGVLQRFAVPADALAGFLGVLQRRQFEDALTKIEKGQWEHARRLLEWCEERWPDDEPRKVLHAFIERDGFTAPAGWPGYRPLTEK